MAVLPLGVAFGVFGALFGVSQVLLPDLKLALRLSDGELGAMLTTGFLATFPAMLVGGPAVDRFGARRSPGADHVGDDLSAVAEVGSPPLTGEGR